MNATQIHINEKDKTLLFQSKDKSSDVITFSSFRILIDNLLPRGFVDKISGIYHKEENAVIYKTLELNFTGLKGTDYTLREDFKVDIFGFTLPCKDLMSDIGKDNLELSFEVPLDVVQESGECGSKKYIFNIADSFRPITVKTEWLNMHGKRGVLALKTPPGPKVVV